MKQTIEEQLLGRILERYKSVRAFAHAIGMPTSTLDSVLKRGIKNSSFCAVVTIFRALDFDIESARSGILTDSPNAERQPVETDGLSKEAERMVKLLREVPENQKELAVDLVESVLLAVIRHAPIPAETQVSVPVASSR